MTIASDHKITFTRLSDVLPEDILAHMNNDRIAKHMPLLKSKWDKQKLAEFIATKEECWQRDGLGHWAICCNNVYVGWGGFQKEGLEWDFGLVLKVDSFGLGARITRKAIDFAHNDERIPFVTFLLPPSRTKLRGLKRLGAKLIKEIDYDGEKFLKYRLDTK